MTTRVRRRRRQESTSSAPSARWIAYAPWIVLGLVVVATAAIRLRLADVPLERDEGEYAYAGQLILQGVPPYEMAYNMKFPGTYYAYALLLAVFGETARGIHIGLLVVHAATTVVVFLIGRRWIDPIAAAVGAAVFSTLALDRWTMGVFAHATHFVLLPALAGVLVLSLAGARPGWQRSAWAGVLFGVAVLMKQQAAAYLLVAIGWVAWRAYRESGGTRDAWRAVVPLAGGAVAPIALTVAVLAAQGVLGRFWFWTVQYAAQYATELPLAEAIPMFQYSWHEITRATWVMWVLAGVGGVGLWASRWAPQARDVLVMLGLASVAAVVPGFYFRQHYFIVMLPVVGLLAGVASVAFGRGIARAVSPAAGFAAALILPAGAIAHYVSAESDYLFRMSPAAISRSVYQDNPFVEAPEIARYLRERTTPADRIAIVGSEPEIYFLAGRRSATGYIHTYALMEPQPYASRMQDEMIREIEGTRPAFLVAVRIPSSWGMLPNSDRRILGWLDRYTAACYDLVGVVSITASGTSMKWDAEVAGFTPPPGNVVNIHRRRSDAPCGADR